MAGMPINPDDYYVTTSRRGEHPERWSWEICRKSQPLGIKMTADGFQSDSAAQFARKKSPRSPTMSMCFSRTVFLRLPSPEEATVQRKPFCRTRPTHTIRESRTIGTGLKYPFPVPQALHRRLFSP